MEAAHAALARAVDQRTSELLRTEEQLRQAQKMEAVGRLAGGVAHDFNNLLSVILSYTSLALGDIHAGHTLHTELEEIKRAAERAAELTRQLLAFSRQQVLEPRIVDLNDVITRLDRMLRRLIGEDIELRTVTSEELGRVKVDPHQIEQVIMNLVVNARDAMPGGGVLTIETADVDFDLDASQDHIGIKPGRYVMLAVSDTGIGMDRETQARIFEPFFTTKPLGKGTGLGLSTVFGIVSQSGGHVWVYSEPARGASFKVYLPRADSEEIRTESRPPLEQHEGTQTVLLVEDEDQVRRVVMSVLRRNGYTVLEARDPAEALRLTQDHPNPIDLLLTDIVMPQLSGPELARRILLLRPQIRVICMSGYTDETVLNHGVLEAGMAFLQKPLTPDALLRKLREVLAD
jgi:nitrogen-specific signal transduction histidine kinase/ActR/RegA family two-component response regulator